jgi:hypothetical protein
VIRDGFFGILVLRSYTIGYEYCISSCLEDEPYSGKCMEIQAIHCASHFKSDSGSVHKKFTEEGFHYVT